MTERRGVPRRPIFWTLDQVAGMLNLSVPVLRNSYVWFDGKDVGVYQRDYLLAVNLARASINAGQPDWRIEDSEFIRWLARHKLWVYTDHAPQLVSLREPRTRPLTRTKQTGTIVDIVEPPTFPQEDPA